MGGRLPSCVQAPMRKLEHDSTRSCWANLKNSENRAALRLGRRSTHCTSASRGHWQVAYSSIKVRLPLGHPQRVAAHRPHSGSMQISKVVSSTLGSCERLDGAAWLEYTCPVSVDVDRGRTATRLAADSSCAELLGRPWERLGEAQQLLMSLLTLSTSLSTSLPSECGATVACASIFSCSARFISLTSS